MPDRDTATFRTSDVATALALLTRLPTPGGDHTRSSQAAWAYPLAGLVVGTIAALTGAIATGLGLAAAITAGLILIAGVLTTGAMHEDGLADSADGLWGGWDPARRLEIMKDSQIGTYGVLALILSFGLRWTALTMLIDTGQFAGAILAAAVLSRAPMTALMCALPHARSDGLSHSTGKATLRAAQIAASLALILGLLCIGLTVIPVAIAIMLTTIIIALIAKAKIGGQTGDILGATQQVSEIIALIVLTTSLS